MFKGSYKTTSAGLVIILTVLINLTFDIVEGSVTRASALEQMPMLIGGIGLFFARDNGVSSEQAGAK